MKIQSKNKAILLSKKGLKELRKSIIQLERDKQLTLQSIRDLDKTFGHEERLHRIEKMANLEGIESELNDKKLMLSTAKLLPKKQNRLRVAIGSVVDLIDKHGHIFRYTIVDTIEANPSDGRISTASPLGQSLIGRTVADIIQWSNGKYNNQFQLVKIT